MKTKIRGVFALGACALAIISVVALADQFVALWYDWTYDAPSGNLKDPVNIMYAGYSDRSAADIYNNCPADICPVFYSVSGSTQYFRHWNGNYYPDTIQMGDAGLTPWHGWRWHSRLRWADDNNTPGPAHQDYGVYDFGCIDSGRNFGGARDQFASWWWNCPGPQYPDGYNDNGDTRCIGQCDSVSTCSDGLWRWFR